MESTGTPTRLITNNKPGREGDWYVETSVSPLVSDELDLFCDDVVFVSVPASVAPADPICRAATSAAWDSQTEAAEVRILAEQAIDRVNRLLAGDSVLHTPIKIGGAVWHRDASYPSGFNCSYFIFADCSANVSIGGHVPRVEVNGFYAAPSRTRGLRARELAERDAEFARALLFFQEAGDDIRKLWVVHEHVCARYNKVIAGLGDATELEDESFRETANHRGIRHRSRGRVLKWPPMGGADARRFIQQLLNGWVDRENGT